MAKQLIFKNRYIEHLRKELDNDLGIDRYLHPSFDYNDDEVLSLPNIDAPSGTPLAEMMASKKDSEAAIILYDAYAKLEPLQAADPRLWTYLTHVDLYPYMIKRRDGVISGKESNKKDYILKYWFLSSNSQQALMRHPLAGLWWAVYLSIDETRSDKYELTREFLKDVDVSSRTLGTYQLGRHKPAVLGIMEFVHSHPDLFSKNRKDAIRFMVKKLNVLGGSKPLSMFDSDYFYSQCVKMKNEIRLITIGREL